ncbi:heme-binding protein soul2 precursor [Danio rerio]|uniref:SOUL2 n=1 Tax=Danio rerio TaxID=7955 RepID=F2XG12_DANRE|nr:heme-binding protein soul2 precursor [Danio rerio]AEA50993.1 SOUL2 [Danio rerio]|eukprot:NP_001139159.1 heme-binding protein soul2 precursor [Danio rerio]
MAMYVASALCLLVGLVCFTATECWQAPWFCHQKDCPVYTVVNQYGEIEERNYEMSNWITTDILSTGKDDVSTGFWKLYYFIQGQNKENKQIAMTRPVVVSVKDGAEGRRVSISVFQQDPNIPDPVDTTIRKTVVPAGTVYVRSFGGWPSDQDAQDNVQKLKEELKAAGKQFIEDQFEAAGYDSPLELLNRHNEVWVHAP